ncbi:MFS transporter [Candidatus Micrarchaeota archaeon]|nr:MFS transporter [Candidatus Micrarchaeota archaeon]
MFSSLNLNTQNKEFTHLLLLYVLWTASWNLGASLFEVYFFNTGLSITNLLLANTIWFIAGIFAIPLLTKINSKTFMLAATLITLLSFLMIAFFKEPWTAFAFRFLGGLAGFFFWIPFNITYYEFRNNNNAMLGAIYYSVTPLFSLILPTVAGWIAITYGFGPLFILSALCYALTFVIALLFLKNYTFEYNFISSLKAISGLRSLIFLEGFAGTVIVSALLDIVLLVHVTTPFEFGLFVSLTTVFSIVASIVTAKFSDKLKNRGKFMLPIVAGFALASIATALAPNLIMFFIFFGLVQFFCRIFFPLPLALVVDNSKSIIESMAAREFILNIGRVSGALICYLIVISSNIQTALLFEGLVLLLYIPIFENRKKKLKST